MLQRYSPWLAVVFVLAIGSGTDSWGHHRGMQAPYAPVPCWCSDDYCPKAPPCLPYPVKTTCNGGYQRKCPPPRPYQVKTCPDNYCRKPTPCWLGRRPPQVCCPAGCPSCQRQKLTLGQAPQAGVPANVAKSPAGRGSVAKWTR